MLTKITDDFYIDFSELISIDICAATGEKGLPIYLVEWVTRMKAKNFYKSLLLGDTEKLRTALDKYLTGIVHPDLLFIKSSECSFIEPNTGGPTCQPTD